MAATVVELIDVHNERFSPEEFLYGVARRTAALLGGAAAGVLLSDEPDEIRVAAASNLKVRRLDSLEANSRRGPSVEAIRKGVAVNAWTDRMRQRWPVFAAYALAEGYEAISAVPMRYRRHTIGALKVVRCERRRLSPLEIRTAQALADVAAVSLDRQRVLEASRKVAEQLQEALGSRVVIEQAKGMIAAQAGVSLSEAFRLLRRHARDENRKLEAVARDVVGGGRHAADLSSPCRPR